MSAPSPSSLHMNTVTEIRNQLRAIETDYAALYDEAYDSISRSDMKTSGGDAPDPTYRAVQNARAMRSTCSWTATKLEAIEKQLIAITNELSSAIGASRAPEQSDREEPRLISKAQARAIHLERERKTRTG